MDQNSRFWWNLSILSNSSRFAICGPPPITSIAISITWRIKNWQSRRAIRHTGWCEKWNHRNQQKRREIHVHVDASCLNGRQLGNSSKKTFISKNFSFVTRSKLLNVVWIPIRNRWSLYLLQRSINIILRVNGLSLFSSLCRLQWCSASQLAAAFPCRLSGRSSTWSGCSVHDRRRDRHPPDAARSCRPHWQPAGRRARGGARFAGCRLPLPQEAGPGAVCRSQIPPDGSIRPEIMRKMKKKRLRTWQSAWNYV